MGTEPAHHTRSSVDCTHIMVIMLIRGEVKISHFTSQTVVIIIRAEKFCERQAKAHAITLSRAERHECLGRRREAPGEGACGVAETPPGRSPSAGATKQAKRQ
eukprot:scaffold117823_cov39-Prasinocladus_malaysianus.AAC.2